MRYLIPYEVLFKAEYYVWRLQNPSFGDIIQRHFDIYNRRAITEIVRDSVPEDVPLRTGSIPSLLTAIETMQNDKATIHALEIDLKNARDFIAAQNSWIVDRNLWIKERDDWIVERDRVVVQQREWIEERDTWVKDRDLWIKERDCLIQELGLMIKDRDLWVAERDQWIRERDEAIDSLKRQS